VAFAREVLPWRVLALFPRLLQTPGWEDLQRYAEGELGALKEYQLAQRVAAVFDATSPIALNCSSNGSPRAAAPGRRSSGAN